MASEITVTSALSVVKNKLNYTSQPSSFIADMTGTEKGPTPGSISVSRAGTDISLAQLTTPGLCRIMNTSTQTDTNTYFVEYGIWDSNTGKLFVLGELLPGETFVLRLSRWLGQEHGTGTGTGASGTGDTLRFKAHGETTTVIVEAFEK